MSLLFRCFNHLCLNSPNFGTTKLSNWEKRSWEDKQNQRFCSGQWEFQWADGKRWCVAAGRGTGYVCVKATIKILIDYLYECSHFSMIWCAVISGNSPWPPLSSSLEFFLDHSSQVNCQTSTENTNGRKSLLNFAANIPSNGSYKYLFLFVCLF